MGKLILTMNEHNSPDRWSLHNDRKRQAEVNKAMLLPAEKLKAYIRDDSNSPFGRSTLIVAINNLGMAMLRDLDWPMEPDAPYRNRWTGNEVTLEKSDVGFSLIEHWEPDIGPNTVLIGRLEEAKAELAEWRVKHPRKKKIQLIEIRVPTTDNWDLGPPMNKVDPEAIVTYIDGELARLTDHDKICGFRRPIRGRRAHDVRPTGQRRLTLVAICNKRGSPASGRRHYRRLERW